MKYQIVGTNETVGKNCARKLTEDFEAPNDDVAYRKLLSDEIRLDSDFQDFDRLALFRVDQEEKVTRIGDSSVFNLG